MTEKPPNNDPSPGPEAEAYEFRAPVTGPSAEEGWMWLSDNPDGTVTVGRYEGTRLISERVPKETFLTSQKNQESNPESDDRKLEVAEDAGEIAVENSIDEPSEVQEPKESTEGNDIGTPADEIEDVPDDGEPLRGVLRQDGLREVKVTKQFTSKKHKQKYYHVEGFKDPIPANMVTLESSPAYKYLSKGIKIERPPEGKIGRGGRRHFGGYAEGGDGTYQYVYDAGRIAERIGVPQEIVEAAAEKGISPEYLVRAKDNEHAGAYLRSQGLDWGKEMPHAASLAGREITAEELRSITEDSGVEVTTDYVEFARAEAERGNLRPADYLASLGLDLGFGRLDPPDPIILIGEIGRRRRAKIGEVIKQIEKDPGAVRRNLKRPGKLPLWLHKVPFVGQPVGKRVLALRIARKARKDMPRDIERMGKRLEDLQHLGARNEIDQEEMEALPQLIKAKQDELTRAGNRWFVGKYQRYHNYLDNLDESVKAHRKRLSRFERSQLFGESGATQRRNLAYRIFDTRLSLEALRELKIIDMDDPEFVHNHETFKKMRRELQKSTRATAEDIV